MMMVSNNAMIYHKRTDAANAASVLLYLTYGISTTTYSINVSYFRAYML